MSHFASKEELRNSRIVLYDFISKPPGSRHELSSYEAARLVIDEIVKMKSFSCRANELIRWQDM